MNEKAEAELKIAVDKYYHYLFADDQNAFIHRQSISTTLFPCAFLWVWIRTPIESLAFCEHYLFEDFCFK